MSWDHSSLVDAWVKNDHIGFEVLYVYRGVVRKYRPDFIVRLKMGDLLVLEVKGQPDEQSYSKRRALEQWVQAVNQHGGFGQWSAAVSYNPGDIRDILLRHNKRRYQQSRVKCICGKLRSLHSHTYDSKGLEDWIECVKLSKRVCKNTIDWVDREPR